MTRRVPSLGPGIRITGPTPYRGALPGRGYPAVVSATQKTPAAAGPRPRRLTAAAILTGLEGLAIAAGGLYMAGLGLFGHPASVEQAEFGGVTVLVLAALPLTAVRGLLRARRWSRGPAVATQFIALPVGYAMIQTGGALTAAGVAVMAVAVLTAVLLVHPATADALGIRRTA
jgi:hypothetical protein